MIGRACRQTLTIIRPRQAKLLCLAVSVGLASLVVWFRVRNRASPATDASSSVAQGDPKAVGRLLRLGYDLADREDWTAAQREFERVAQLPEAKEIRDGSGQTVAERARRQAEICGRMAQGEEATSNIEHRTPNGERSTLDAQRLTRNQRRKAACGPEALAYALRKRGVTASVDQLMELAGTDEVGTTMEGLQRAAEAKGMKANGYQVTFAGLREVELPVVAFVNKGVTGDEGRGTGAVGNHYVVITRVSGKYVWVVDPAVDETFGHVDGAVRRPAPSKARVRAEELGRVWAGYVLEVVLGEQEEER